MLARKQKALDLLWYEPYKLGHIAGFKDLTHMHNEWLRSFLYSNDDQTMLAHRGSYKTTIDALFLAIHAIIRPNANVLFIRKTDSDVGEVIATVTNILQTGAFQEIVRILYGIDLAFNKATLSEIDTNLHTGVKGQPQILGLGIGTSITGKHADVVVTDDIVNIKDRISRAERDRTRIMYQELLNVKNRGGRFVNTGTPWHKEDAIALMRNVTRYDCYSTGLISKAELQEIRQSMSDSLFAANYELKHIASDGAIFQNPQFTNDEPLIYYGNSHIDAAYGGKDFTAYTVMKQLDDGRIIAFGKLWHKHIDDCLPQIELYQSRYRSGSIAVETNADKGYLAKELRNRELRPFTYPETTNKYIKISTYLRKAWNNIYWLEDTDPEYIAQILDYTEFSEHDDAPDSAASLIRRMEKKPRFSTFEGGL